MTHPISARHRLDLAALRRQASARARGFQIGPKIRIGGPLGAIGEGIKKVGDVMNPAAAAGRAIAGGKNIGEAGQTFVDNSIDKAKGAAIAGAAYLAPGAIGSLGGSTAGQVAIGTAEMGMDAIKNVLGSGGSIVGDFLKDAAGNILGKVGKTIAGMSPMELAMAGLATAQGINAAKSSARAHDLSDKALKLAEDNWNSGAAMRDQGRAGLLSPTKSDLSSVFADKTNVFGGGAQRRPLPPQPTPMPAVPPATAPMSGAGVPSLRPLPTSMQQIIASLPRPEGTPSLPGAPPLPPLGADNYGHPLSDGLFRGAPPMASPGATAGQGFRAVPRRPLLNVRPMVAQ
jgi:hypothetical protein